MSAQAPRAESTALAIPTLSRRERYRAQTRDEAKDIALRQLAEAGPSALSLNAIAKEMGVTGPALYRYFAGRDELLTELVVDAYHDLADSVDAAAAAVKRSAPKKRAETVADAYRRWALDHPHRFRLLYGEPIPGYPAHSANAIKAAQRVFEVVVDTVQALMPEPAPTKPRDRLLAQIADWSRRNNFDHYTPETLLVGLKWWSRLYGDIRLEIEGNWTSMGVDAQLLFDSELNDLLPG